MTLRCPLCSKPVGKAATPEKRLALLAAHLRANHEVRP